MAFRPTISRLLAWLRSFLLTLFTLKSLLFLVVWLLLEATVILSLTLLLKTPFIPAFEFAQMISIIFVLFTTLYSNLDLTGRESYLQSRRMTLNPSYPPQGSPNPNPTISRVRIYLRDTRAAQVLVFLLSLTLLLSTQAFY